MITLIIYISFSFLYTIGAMVMSLQKDKMHCIARIFQFFIIFLFWPAS